MSPITLDTHNQFVTTEGKQLGVSLHVKKGRSQFRDSETGTLLASGMTPQRFCAVFWYRDDYMEPQPDNAV